MPTEHPSEELLFACLRPDASPAARAALAELRDEDWPALLALANEHLVQPLLAHRLLAPSLRDSVPETQKAALRAIVEQVALRNMIQHRDFAAAVTALQARGIPVIALKGMQLASLVYGDLGVRSMKDADLLVPTPHLGAAAEAMESLGYLPFQPYHLIDGGTPYFLHHIPSFMQPGKTTIEIHWQLLPPRHGVTVNLDELWQRARPARIAGVDVLVLAAEDLLVHLAIHATYSHLCEFSARPWCDIAQVIRHFADVLSWPEVVDRATRWRCRSGTYLALRMARELVGADVPDDVLQSLRPPHFDERLMRIAIRPRPELTLNRGFLALARRQGVAAKLRTIASRVFVPRHELADFYDVPRASPRVYGLYARRVKDLLLQWRTVRDVRAGGRLREVAEESAAMEAFLQDEWR
jgi:hypothetical protein